MNNKTQVRVELLSGRKNVKRAMLASMGISLSSNQDEFLKRIQYRLTDKTMFDLLIGKHSPIEEMEFWIEMIVPERVHTHFIRHKEIGKYVATARPDLLHSTPIDDGMRIMSMRINAKRLIEISGQRLCYRAWHETISVWKEVCQQCIKLEPILSFFLYRPCVKCGYCTQGSLTCGNKTFKYEREYFLNDMNNFLESK